MALATTMAGHMMVSPYGLGLVHENNLGKYVAK